MENLVKKSCLYAAQREWRLTGCGEKPAHGGDLLDFWGQDGDVL
jgi:hypothetical protein